MDEFWIKNPSILIDKYWELIPTTKMSTIYQLNVISRFLIILIILLIIFDKDNSILILCLVFLILIIIYYFIYIYDPKSINIDINENFRSEIDEYTQKTSCGYDSCNLDKTSPINALYNLPENNRQLLKDLSNTTDNVEIQSGYIDYNGNYIIGKQNTPFSNEKSRYSKINYELNENLKKNKAREPTADNPYMNIVFSDYLDGGNVPEPLNSSDENVDTQDKSLNLYNSTIYRNIEDVFERQNSQRLFYTLPVVTIPNNQTEFARWLYDTGPRCKEDTSKCTYFEEPYMTSPRY